MSDPARWADLAPRLLSGVLLAAAGVAVVWLGGWVFAVALSVLAALMTWEAARLFGVANPVPVAVMGGVSVLASAILPALAVLPVLLAAALSGTAQAGRGRGIHGALACWILLGSAAFLALRDGLGFGWLAWLVMLVVVSDVAGYFAGRLLGGPKFWPRVSPKKTWSGTLAGWVGAAAVGAGFAAPLGAGAALVPVSVLVAFAGQMGDIAESAAKRHVGAKDSSTLIPGHGGLLDRFDAMLGAGAFVYIIWSFNMLPGEA